MIPDNYEEKKGEDMKKVLSCKNEKKQPIAQSKNRKSCMIARRIMQDFWLPKNDGEFCVNGKKCFLFRQNKDSTLRSAQKM